MKSLTTFGEHHWSIKSRSCCWFSCEKFRSVWQNHNSLM